MMLIFLYICVFVKHSEPCELRFLLKVILFHAVSTSQCAK